MDDKEAARLLNRAMELRELAKTIKSEKNRALLLYSAENFLRLAMQVLGPEKES